MKRALKALLIISVSFAGCVHPAWAEVMDKEPAFSLIGLWVLVAAVVGFVICRWKPLWGVVSFGAFCIFLFSTISELVDPSVGFALRQEMGKFLLLQWCVAFVVVVLAHLFGIMLHRRTMTPLYKCC